MHRRHGVRALAGDASPLIRILFVCTTALLAASLGDAVIEGVSNSGRLWHGHYTDQSSLDLAPAVALGAIGALLTLGLRVWHSLRPDLGSRLRSLLQSSSRQLRPAEVVRLLPAILILQFAVLWSMESVEQLVVYGHLFGGTLWLGGPVAASVCAHALFALAAALGVAQATSALARALTRIVRCILRWSAARRPSHPIVAHRFEIPGRRMHLITPAARRKRGPPLPIAFA